MTTKQYLTQISVYDKRINTKLSEIFKLRTLLQSITVCSKEDVVQTSGSKDKLGDSIAKIVDLENEINDLVDEMVVTRKFIIEQIENMENYNENNVLYLKYVLGMSFEEVAENMNYSVRQVIRIHGYALSNFEKKYGKNYIMS
jgi:DNA-directed RNA polymerase specialized sigma subunit